MASQSDDAVAGATQPLTTESRDDQTQLPSPNQPTESENIPISPTSVNEEFRDAMQEQQPDRTPSADVAMPLSHTLSMTAPSPPQLSRKESEALGPATEVPIAHLSPSTTGRRTLSISLMLTTGARHPYKIDEKYLTSRKIEAVGADGSFDPREVSGYQLKELIWTDWRSEWEPRPATPSSIRLIIMGRMIEDKYALKDFPFNIETTNVVHMTVKPADLVDDEETAAKTTGKGSTLRARDTEDRGAGCRCVIL